MATLDYESCSSKYARGLSHTYEFQLLDNSKTCQKVYLQLHEN